MTNQPITMEAPGYSPRYKFDLIKVTVKYGKIDIWTDSQRMDGVLNSTATRTNLSVGTHVVTTNDVTKVVFTAAGAGTAINNSVLPAAIESVVIGWP